MGYSAGIKFSSGLVLAVAILSYARAEDCTATMDLVFLLDTSGSICSGDPTNNDGHCQNWVSVIDFIIDIIGSLTISSTNERVGVVLFSSNADVKWKLDAYTTSAGLNQAVRALENEKCKGRTNTADGLKQVRTNVLGQPGDRPNVDDVVIIVTDGQPTVDVADTIPQANALKAQAKVFVVGITQSINEDTLKMLSSNPQQKDENYFTSPNFSNLDQILENILIQACEAKANCITNCEVAYCTRDLDQRCGRCKYHRSEIIKAYILKPHEGAINKICQQVCSWRSDSSYCYPGLCPGTPSSCNCAPGFSGINCMTVNDSPSIASCHASGQLKNGGTVADFVDIPCENQISVVYTNLKVTHLKLDWNAVFKGPTASNYPQPYYIADFKVGVISASVTIQHKRGGANLATFTIDCNKGASKTNPDVGIHNCDKTEAITIDHLHGDTLSTVFQATNGGYVKINNYDDSSLPSVGNHKFYSGRSNTTTTSLVFDFERPVHCSQSGCADNYLDIGDHYTINGAITISWSGWSDSPANINQTEIHVYKMVPYGQVLGYRTQGPLVQKVFVPSVSAFQVTIIPEDAGMFCILLTVDDNAGNYVAARRFVLYDNYSNLTTVERNDTKMWVDSAAANTSYVWITNLQDTNNVGPKVTTKWPGHFINQFHVDHKLLNAVEAHSPASDIAHEDTQGQPPLVRSREAIENVNGIVKYQVGYRVDRKGGNTTVQPPSAWTEVTKFTDEEVTIDIPRTDGDSVRIFIKGHDVMNKTKTDSVLIHVDSSPPIIRNVWLSRHGVGQLAVHHSEDLFHMNLEFESYDMHSGLKEVHWELHDMADPSRVHGEGHVAVARPSVVSPECPVRDCYCIPKGDCFFRNFTVSPDKNKLHIPTGDHDFDYLFIITVTSNAMLQTVYKYQITIDTSPPHTGVVRDNTPGNLDLDYQTSMTFRASWEGFFDKQSGVMFYQYGFSTGCLKADDFAIPAPAGVFQTEDTFASHSVTQAAKYHVTVIAYNAALEPSVAVCSDGVTIDTTPPTLREADVVGLWTKEGVAKDDDGHIWYIDEHRGRYLLENATVQCSTTATLITDIETYPLRNLPMHAVEKIDCSALKGARNMAYLHEEEKIELSWFGGDAESGIYDYEVGVSSTGSDVIDVLPYQSTHSHRHILTYHAGLADKSTVYIHIKAINRATMQTVKVIGPILVVAGTPVFTGNLDLQKTTDNGSDYLVSNWQAGSYDPSQISNRVILSYMVAVGHNPNGEEVRNFTTIKSLSFPPSVCTVTDPPTCVAIPVSQLDWGLHGRHAYHLTLKLVGVQGTHTLVTSSPYIHLHGPPLPGIVVEQPLAGDSKLVHDLDHQSSTSSLRITWRDFHHPDQTISYMVGLGTAPGLDDVVALTAVQGRTTSRLFEGLSLQAFQTYFGKVVASCTDGSTEVSSNGVLVLPNDIRADEFTVKDGIPCNLTKDLSARFDHHEDLNHKTPCNIDLQFQSSITSYSCFWKIPSALKTYVNSIMIALEELDTATGVWLEIEPLRDIGLVTHIVMTNLHLEGGHNYRAKVQPCHPDGCFKPVYTDGLKVYADPPIATGQVNVSLDNSLNNSSLVLSWEQFRSPYDDLEVDNQYVWTLIVRHSDRYIEEQLFPWRSIPAEVLAYVSNSTKLSYEAVLPHSLLFSSCVLVAIRGFSPVGQYDTIYGELGGCDVQSREENVILDAVGRFSEDMNDVENIFLDENAHWNEPDRDYTPSETVISAVWPSLRHGKYSWKVVHDPSSLQRAYKDSGSRMSYTAFHCASPEVLACGQTTLNFVNARNILLEHGKRYHVCIHANATIAEFETFSQPLDEVSVCSSGVAVDRHPPETGRVWVGGPGEEWKAQVDASQLDIYWSGFTDVETLGPMAHHSGIHYYQYAIGTYPGGVDVRGHTVVGVTNMAVAHGLALQSGTTYYITVNATDFAGRSSEAQGTGVTVDTSPPVVTSVPIDTGDMYVTEAKHLSATWHGTFSDIETGIWKYGWCIGKQKNHCDVVGVQYTSDEKTSEMETSLALDDGQEYYFTVQAINGAGLISIATSRAIVVDSTAPIAGHVYETTAISNGLDVDYQTTLSELLVTWAGFHETHTHLTGYDVTVGKCPDCDDILEESNVGLATDLFLDHLELEQGQVYYTKVKACNPSGLCITATSDGVVPDITPPIVGQVDDGATDDDIQYQYSREILSGHWLNTHDVHGGLSHMTWSAGRTPGGSDILPVTRLHLVESASIYMDSPLPIGVKIYITVMAFDKAGLSSQKTSNGFIVDNTAPEFTQKVTLDHTLGSFYTNTLTWTSSVTVTWNSRDPDSPVVEHYLSIMTRDSDHLQVPTLKVLGDVTTYTFTNVSLSDGEMYFVKVITCNAAKICTTSVSDGIMVDNSPPTSGAFAVGTDHAAALTRHRDNWMTYDNTGQSPVAKLAWLGFSDGHSDILTYHMTIGTTYAGSDLAGAPTPVNVSPKASDSHEDEGYIQTGTIVLSANLQENVDIYVSIWAENNVGLVSERLHGTFVAIPSSPGKGSLDLKRRCDVISCKGHCSCADKAHICDDFNTCSDVTGLAGYQSLTVKDVINYAVNPAQSSSLDVDFTRSQCALAAVWTLNSGIGGAKPLRYEWSAGISGEDPGSGLFDVLQESVWRELGHQDRAIYTTRGSKLPDAEISPHVNYTFYVRAWYESNKYAIYQSDGVSTDALAPEISRSYKVMEVKDTASTGDVDYVTSTSALYARWQYVFRDSNADIVTYKASVGTFPGGADGATKELDGTMYTTRFDVTLEEGMKYFVTITAINQAGLYNTAVSDGVVVDLTAPVTGIVRDGELLTDIDFIAGIPLNSGSPFRLLVSWHGFYDDVSGIDFYTICVGRNPEGSDVVACLDVGLHTKYSLDIPQLLSGTRVYTTVYATDAAGLRSPPATSDGVMVDYTPPQPVQRFQFGANLIRNPSFEAGSFQEGRYTLVPPEWSGSGQVTLYKNTSGIAYHNTNYVELEDGYIRQSIATTPGTKYRLTLFAAGLEGRDDHYANPMGYVSLPGNHQQFILAPKPTGSQQINAAWGKHIFFFVAEGVSTWVKIGSNGRRNGLSLDNILVVEMQDGERSGQPDPQHPRADDMQPIHFHVSALGSYVTISASWDVIDPESPVVRNSWAIGTVHGGTQISSFESLARRTHGRKELVSVPHGTTIYVTVVIENAADLKTIIYSDPILLDLTPPVVCCLQDSSGIPIQFITSSTVSVKWNATDVEQGVEHCEISIGESPGSQELVPWQRSMQKENTRITFEENDLRLLSTLYISLRCVNYGGLYAYYHSDPIHVIMTSPDSSSGYIKVITKSETLYPARDEHQADTNTVCVGWGGLGHHPGISHYQVMVQEPGSGAVLIPWRDIESTTISYSRLTGLQMTSNNQYKVLLRVVNVAGLQSESIAANFTVETEIPRLTGQSPTSHWINEWTLVLDWVNVFSSLSELQYEVTIGTRTGGLDVLSWTESKGTEMKITGVDSSKKHYINLTAINKAGLYKTISFTTIYSTS